MATATNSLAKQGGALARHVPISSSARKHLVDTQHMERVHADAHVERVLTALLGDVLVARNAGSLEGLARQLLLLERHQVDAVRELLYVGLLPAEIKDPELGIGHTTAVARLDVGLVLAVAVAPRRSCNRESNEEKASVKPSHSTREQAQRSTRYTARHDETRQDMICW